METVKISPKYQVVIPKKFGIALNLLYQATGWTQDADFKELKGAKYIRKKK